MNTKIIVYKVVVDRTFEKMRFRSFASGQCSICYYIGREYVNKTQPFFAFKTYEYAKDLINKEMIGEFYFGRPDPNPLVILKCEAVASQYQPKIASIYRDNLCVQRFWENIHIDRTHHRKNVVFLNDYYQGTILCEYIKPIKIIA